MIFNDISKLILYLEQTHEYGDLYRGQNKDYPLMTPSYYRPFAKDLSKPSAIIEIDKTKYETALATNITFNIRSRFMQKVISELGLGFGNILAQQYSMQSETIDVTEDINIAAYFATRKYPTYKHFENDGIGVIYRFRDLMNDGVQAPKDLLDLRAHFESGICDDGFFDFFVKENQLHAVFDRDKWDPHEFIEQVVSTPRLILSWNSLRKIISNDSEKVKASIRAVYNQSDEINWDYTRFESQKGGLLRPRMLWKARTPSNYEIADDTDEAFKIRSRGNFSVRLPGRNPGLKWPLIVPSSAIKSEFIGVENLRENQCCEVFFFNHSVKKVTGIYRRDLWPEPDEDPVYGALWLKAISILLPEYINNDHIPPVYDPKLGIMQSGYKLEDFASNNDGRDEKELAIGQIQDSLETIENGLPTVKDYGYQVVARVNLGEPREAIRAAIRGIRKYPNDPDLYHLLAHSLQLTGRPKVAEHFLNISKKLAAL